MSAASGGSLAPWRILSKHAGTVTTNDSTHNTHIVTIINQTLMRTPDNKQRCLTMDFEWLHIKYDLFISFLSLWYHGDISAPTSSCTARIGKCLVTASREISPWSSHFLEDLPSSGDKTISAIHKRYYLEDTCGGFELRNWLCQGERSWSCWPDTE